MRKMIVAVVLAIIATFSVAHAYDLWARRSTPCDDIKLLAGTPQDPMVVCAEDPGTIRYLP